MAAPVPAAIVRARRAVVARLREVGAVSMAGAVPYAPRRRIDRRALAWLVEHDVVRPAGQNRYFVDEDAAQAWRRGRRIRTALKIGGALAVVGALFALARDTKR